MCGFGLKFEGGTCGATKVSPQKGLEVAVPSLLQVSGFGDEASGFRYQDSGFGHQVSGFESRDSGAGFRHKNAALPPGRAFAVAGLGFRG